MPPKGWRSSAETRAKISAALKGRPGHPQSIETRAKLAEGMRRRLLESPDARAQLVELGRALTQSPEVRAKISSAGKAKWTEAEYRAGQSVRLGEMAREVNERRRLYPPGRKQRANTLRRHGLTLADESRMIAAQSGRCAICGTDQPAFGTRPGPRRVHREWCVDHDHVTGRVRGLLCHGCNLSVGYIERAMRMQLMHRVVSYLEETA